jgi:predicted  nucleic acid-binding Zn ribbon protein
MYIQKVSIKVKSKVDIDEIAEDMDLMMNFYRGSGQKQGNLESQYVSKRKIITFPYTLKKNSLDNKFNNFYVNRQIEKIETKAKAKIKFKTVGKTYESYDGVCKCKKPTSYILITNYITIVSPIICGKCTQSVPLYRLPIYYDYGYMPILSWETNYSSCDSLQMNCEVGERWALKQMQNLNLQLSKQGMEICKKIEKSTNIPTYYYLYNYNKYKNDDKNRPCPKCHQKWNLKKRLGKQFDFKCYKCRIISTLSIET